MHIQVRWGIHRLLIQREPEPQRANTWTCLIDAHQGGAKRIGRINIRMKTEVEIYFLHVTKGAMEGALPSSNACMMAIKGVGMRVR